ncbi:MAG: glutaredoxin family protein [Deltaproteobacteria bacterium]|nr:glutaredoxin family protein [Deltaproteobacteria bacterium]
MASITKLLVEVYARKDCDRCSYFKSTPSCALCHDVKGVIDRVMSEVPFQFKEVDICSCEDLHRRYKEDIPTVFINGKKAFKFKVDEAEFRRKLRKELIKAGLMRITGKKRRQYS